MRFVLTRSMAFSSNGKAGRANSLTRDLVEKGVQVQMMGRIYQSADRVLVWLGSCDPERSKGVPGLEALAQIPPDERPPCYKQKLRDQSKPIKNSQSEIAGIPLEAVTKTAVDITTRQWFKRIWVLQEFLLARQVVFYYGYHQISLKTLLVTFNWTYNAIDPNIGLGGGRSSATEALALGFEPHAQDIQDVLSARPLVARGHRFTLREWMEIGRRRSAEKPRDHILGGLSLIDPSTLQIDAARLQPVPGGAQIKARKSLIPKGFWPALTADYSVSEGEFLVNLAACLLSTSDSNTLDLLSIASHQPESRVSEFITLQGRNSDLQDVPSWVPVLGVNEVILLIWKCSTKITFHADAHKI